MVCFADERRSSDNGEALVLVECKTVVKDLAAAARQVRSYALWLLPAYYVITNAQTVSVWDFQGAIAPDREVLTIKQDELEEKFDDLYALLEGRAANRQTCSPRMPRPQSTCHARGKTT